MFWIFILFASLAAFFVKLGAYSVWVSMLALFLKLAVIIIVVLSVALLWKKVSRKRDH